MDVMKQEQANFQQQAFALPVLDEEDYQHPMAQLYNTWVRSLREIEASYEEVSMDTQ